MNAGCLLVFMKWPEPGRVKTRLAPQVGQHGAAQLYRWLLTQTIRTAERAAAVLDLELWAVFDPATKREQFQRLLGGAWRLVPQARGSLGDRLRSAFEAAFSAGRQPVLAIGTDCPWLTPAVVQQACDELTGCDAVFGPTEDGGYYLVGLNRMESELFEGIPWSSSETLACSLRRARALGLRVALLQKLSDVDRPEDLPRLRADFSEAPIRPEPN